MRKPVIIKFTQNHKMNDIEYQSLTDITNQTKRAYGCNEFFPETYSKGKILKMDKKALGSK